MIDLNLQNLKGVEITEKAPFEIKQEFLDYLDNEDFIEKIEDFTAKAKSFQDIVILGIGGSALGTKFLQESLGKSNSPSLHVLDNIDPNLITDLEPKIDYEKTLFIVISKSGETIETISQYKYFQEKTKNFVIITDPQNSPLLDTPYETFEIPENIGGRFSILTAVGLLPAALLGIDIKKIIKGAKNMRDQGQNLAYNLAQTQHSLEKPINVLMPYSNKLKAFTHWYAQLLAESIGKDGKGITPVTALGASDQHSQIQLYNNGPNDKLIIFLEVTDHENETKIPGEKYSFADLLNIEKQATEQALTEKGRPNITIKIPQINEETIGELIILMESSIAFLGELYGINAYDQPGVELGKKLTKQLLKKHYA
jgi:glucose-6-phosphate isomerase